jgi:replication factor C subunit 3/5
MAYNLKHQPKTFEKLHFGFETAAKLKRLAQSDEFPNLLIHGPTGSGKHTQILCLLNKYFGWGYILKDRI